MAYNLCTTCIRRQECVYRHGRDSVQFCEEFEGERPHKRSRPANEARAVAAR